MILRVKSKISSRKTIYRVNLCKQTVKTATAKYMSRCPFSFLDYIYMPCYISGGGNGIKSTVGEKGTLGITFQYPKNSKIQQPIGTTGKHLSSLITL
jgi:hypothetical protein